MHRVADKHLFVAGLGIVQLVLVVCGEAGDDWLGLFFAKPVDSEFELVDGRFGVNRVLQKLVSSVQRGLGRAGASLKIVSVFAGRFRGLGLEMGCGHGFLCGFILRFNASTDALVFQRLDGSVSVFRRLPQIDQGALLAGLAHLLLPENPLLRASTHRLRSQRANAVFRCWREAAVVALTHDDGLPALFPLVEGGVLQELAVQSRVLRREVFQDVGLVEKSVELIHASRVLRRDSALRRDPALRRVLLPQTEALLPQHAFRVSFSASRHRRVWAVPPAAAREHDKIVIQELLHQACSAGWWKSEFC